MLSSKQASNQTTAMPSDIYFIFAINVQGKAARFLINREWKALLYYLLPWFHGKENKNP
jgi:hypothetical protein